MDSPKLKPCPYCGGTNITYVNFSNSYWSFCVVKCNDCGLEGPKLYTFMKHAVEAWNSLPRRHEITPNSVDCQGCPERRHRSHAHD